MLGQDSGQRSTLTLNHGHYYVDTSNNCDAQGMCLASNPASSHGVSVFQGGQTYYVYFIYGKASTQLTFDIYLGPNDETGKWKVVPVRGIFDTDTYVFKTVVGGPVTMACESGVRQRHESANRNRGSEQEYDCGRIR